MVCFKYSVALGLSTWGAQMTVKSLPVLLCCVGYQKSAKISSEKKGGASEAAADIQCFELQSYFLWRTSRLLQKLHKDVLG